MGMRQMRTITPFNGLIGQESQVPPRMTDRGFTTRQRRQLRPLAPVDLHRTARTRFVLQHGQALLSIPIPPRAHRHIPHAQGRCDRRQPLAPIQLQQTGRSFVALDPQRLFLQSCHQIRTIPLTQRNMGCTHRLLPENLAIN